MGCLAHGQLTHTPRISIRLTRSVIIVTLITSIAALGQTNLNDVHVDTRPTSIDSHNAVSPDLQNHVKVNVDLVLVPVTVTDDNNRVVLGLDQHNFQVFENKQLQTVKSFSNTDIPLSIGIILDTSGSMSTKIDRARDAVNAFLQTANPQDQFFMITFSDTPTELVSFTDSGNEIQNNLALTVPKGRTALLDAIYMGVTKLKDAKYARKALLLISDGGDNHSRYTERDVKAVVKEADVMIYAIGIYDRYFRTEEERLGPGLLTEVSELTGGRTFSLDNPNELPDVAGKIGAELRNQYVIGYRPHAEERDGKWHKIKVKLLPPKGLPPLRVYARQGYYASVE